jgi:serine/threonine-protein kinase
MCAALAASCAPETSVEVGAFTVALRPDEPGASGPRFDVSDTVERYGTPGGNFLVHFTRSGRNGVPAADADGSGVPDFVEQVGAAYEAALAHYAARGFRRPLSDETVVAASNVDGRIDVYLVNFESGATGAFTRDACREGPDVCVGHIVQDNDFFGSGFPSRAEAISVLASHELFHAVQAAYDADQPAVFSEGTAVWATEDFDPSTSDFERFSFSYAADPSRSLAQVATGPVDPFTYGAAVFFRFLTEEVDPHLVRSLLEAVEDGARGVAEPTWIGALGDVLTADLGRSLGATWDTFVSWMLATGAQATAGFGFFGAETIAEPSAERVALPFRDDRVRMLRLSFRVYDVQPDARDEVVVEVVAPPARPTAAEGISIVAAAFRTGELPSLAIGAATAGPVTLDVRGARAVRVAIARAADDDGGSGRVPALCMGSRSEVLRCRATLMGDAADAGAADAGADAAVDAGSDLDAGVGDGDSSAVPPPPSSGCGCRAVGASAARAGGARSEGLASSSPSSGAAARAGSRTTELLSARGSGLPWLGLGLALAYACRARSRHRRLSSPHPRLHASTGGWPPAVCHLRPAAPSPCRSHRVAARLRTAYGVRRERWVLARGVGGRARRLPRMGRRRVPSGRHGLRQRRGRAFRRPARGSAPGGPRGRFACARHHRSEASRTRRFVAAILSWARTNEPGNAMKICPKCGLKYTDDKARCFVDGAGLQAMPDERIGQIIAGRYLIERKLGEGGMATVYRARHTLVDKPVAIKIMAPHLTKDASLRERFRREAKNAASLAHPNIVEILDTGDTDDGTAFLVMELLEGVSLADLIRQQGPLPAPRVAEIGIQIARGLARAHDFQVIHRDLKPDNIFLHRGPGGRTIVKLLDFGIARSLHDSRLTNAGELFGTPQYMAPERVTSIDAGPLADLYAVGCIFYEMLTGRVPFDAPQLPAILIKHMQETPPAPSSLVPGVPRQLEALVQRLMEKKPENRPVDAHQLIKELLPLVPAEVAADVAMPTPEVGVTRQAAATLPPTTLERWARRAAVFEQMIRRAYPTSAPPPELARALDELKAVIARINELRVAGLREQRKLEAMEQNARDARTRLGHAVDTLGVDLSQARQALQSARQEVTPYFDADARARAAYVAAHERLAKSGFAGGVTTPTAEAAQRFREVAEALDHWVLSSVAAEKARRWLESKEREVQDLEFQVQALRAQRERVERQYESERELIEQMLQANGREIASADQRLMALGSAIVEPLRLRASELGDLFAELESPAV